MKKTVLTFCTVLLLATQAPVASAEEVSEKAKVNYFQSVSDYRLKVNKAWSNVQWPVKKVEVTQQTAAKNPVEEVTQQPTQLAPKEEITQETKAPEITEETPKATQQTIESVTKQEPVKQVAASDIDAIEQQVVALTNKERAKYSLPALAMDKPLMAAAREKSLDMQVNNYFSHTSPTYGSPFDRLKALGIAYRSAGENIAKGQSSAAQVVEAWMNSEGHRANILNQDFTHIGVGYVKQGHVWTQQFIKK